MQTRVNSFGTKSLEMVQQVIKAGEPDPSAVATTIMVCFDFEHRVSENLPDIWKTKISRF